MKKSTELLRALEALAKKADKVSDLIEEASWDSREWGHQVKSQEVVRAIQEMREEIARTEVDNEDYGKSEPNSDRYKRAVAMDL